jgi:glutamate dehydrogenase (NAD(P)+)
MTDAGETRPAPDVARIMTQVKVFRDVKLNGDVFPLVVETRHGGVTACTAVHRQQFGQRQGGVRFVRAGSIQELGHLARGMTEKCAASGLQVDGLKCLVICPDGEPEGADEKASILSEHIRAVIAEDVGAVFGPDMGCPEEVLSRVAEQGGLLSHVTGLTAEWGGLEIDKRGYTALGLVHAIGEATRVMYRPLTYSIQGFGAVGAHAANLISDGGGIVRAVSNVNGVLAADEGLDIRRLFRLWKEFGDDSLRRYAAECTSRAAEFSRDPEHLFEVRADVFLPAARTSVLALPEEMLRVRRENPRVRDVTRFLDRTNVRLVAEGANHPLTEGAERFLEEEGVIILPDVLVNCGGVIGCRLEWEHREECLKYPERLSALDAYCRYRIKETITRNVAVILSSDEGARDTAGAIIKLGSAGLAHLLEATESTRSPDR